MTWFNLPLTQDPPSGDGANAATPVVVDAASASAWLARQPQANALGLQSSLLQALEAMNGWRLPAQKRFDALEALRETLFAVDDECRRRFERKPLPLAENEQRVFDTARRLWHAAATGYLHCLRSAVDATASGGDPARITQFAACVAHRALVSLRLELTNNLLAAHEADGTLWRNLHAILATAEELGVRDTAVVDRLLGETRDSTIGGQYAMALLLHLAQAWSLSRVQFLACSRWFARWRETVPVLSERPQRDDASGKAAAAAPTRLLALDLALDRALPRRGEVPGIPRWLVLDGVLRKMRQRRRALAEGESPEALKLGSELSADDCSKLLDTLMARLKEAARRAPLRACDGTNGSESPRLGVVAGLPDIYHWLGGPTLAATDDAALRLQRREQEQIAIFGHVVRNEAAAITPEVWQLAQEECDACQAEDAGTDPAKANQLQLRLCRPAGTGSGRLSPRELIAAKLPGETGVQLLRVDSVLARLDGSLSLLVHLLPGTPQALLAEARERGSGRQLRETALLLAITESAAASDSLTGQDGVPQPGDGKQQYLAVVPAGLPGRSSALALNGSDKHRYRLLQCREHGVGDEVWECSAAP
ncbi:hypothetical protein [Rhodocyclus tenuis]|uniref:hypothetical protein n=1 Tax=Rhodocyclus tenuis TaxID=1066 RepID=UPI0019080163|nr:hypothetical protein [Rhodocyclus tenuis]MBK1681655.1 hypothetical protein [Rhodocyclus tenuis]